MWIVITNTLGRISCSVIYKPTMLTFLGIVVVYVENSARLGLHFRSTELEIIGILIVKLEHSDSLLNFES